MINGKNRRYQIQLSERLLNLHQHPPETLLFNLEFNIKFFSLKVILKLVLSTSDRSLVTLALVLIFLPLYYARIGVIHHFLTLCHALHF